MNLPPPDWYDNPEEPGTYRWWDGAKWSDSVRQGDDADPADSVQEQRATKSDPDDYSETKKQWPAVFGALSLTTVALIGLAIAGGGIEDQPERDVRPDSNRSDSGVNESSTDTRAESQDSTFEQQLDEELSGGNPRCWPVWHGQFEPSWGCTDVSFLSDFDGDVCEAVEKGDPSVYDYVSSWNQGQSGFMHLSTRREREELLSKIALAQYIVEEQRQASQGDILVSDSVAGRGLQSILIAIDAPDRQMQESMANEFSRASGSWLEEFNRHCGAGASNGAESSGTSSNNTSEEVAEESDGTRIHDDQLTVYEIYTGLYEVECSQESLGAFGETPTVHSDFRSSNQDFFDGRLFYGVGVLLSRHDWTNDDGLEGTNVEVLVLAGQPGEMNYRRGGGHALPGDVQSYSSYGGDSMVLGDPKPGDILLWFTSNRFDYGWATSRQPASSNVGLSDIESSACEVVWEDEGL